MPPCQLHCENSSTAPPLRTPLLKIPRLEMPKTQAISKKSQIEVCQSRAACGQRPLSLRSPFRPTCSDHPTEYTCTRQLVALRTRAKNNFTTPLAVCTANAINAVLKMCITPYLAQFSCHDPHPTPSGTARAANFPDLRARRSIWPKICLPSSASQPHFSLVLSQSPARGAH